MLIVIPVPIPSAPEVPQRNDPATFEVRNDAATEYQFETLPAAIDQQSGATYQNALAGQAAATTATEKAEAAALDAEATAADRVATGQDRVATDENREQTRLDRIATGEYALATAADRAQTGQDRQAVNDALAGIAGGPVASVNGKPGPDPVLSAEDIGAVPFGNTSILAQLQATALSF